MYRYLGKLNIDDLLEGPVSETTPGYDTYLSQLSHDLIRLQDSFFYQQFSYEIVTAYGTDDWINALRKAVHPAGFAAFGKVQISTQLDAKTGTIGASLGGGFAHPAAPGTITSIVDVFDSVQKMNFQTIIQNFQLLIVHLILN